jgi:hypothetical protein
MTHTPKITPFLITCYILCAQLFLYGVMYSVCHQFQVFLSTICVTYHLLQHFTFLFSSSSPIFHFISISGYKPPPPPPSIWCICLRFRYLIGTVRVTKIFSLCAVVLLCRCFRSGCSTFTLQRKNTPWLFHKYLHESEASSRSSNHDVTSIL